MNWKPLIGLAKISTAIGVAVSCIAASIHFTTYVKQVSVIDGDTIKIDGSRVRIWGIDAPEKSQVCQRNGEPWRAGMDAAYMMEEILVDRPARLICHDREKADRYGRRVSACFLGEVDIGELMVRLGYAWDYPRYSLGKYAKAENEARVAGRGIWAPGAHCDLPWEWRKRNRPQE